MIRMIRPGQNWDSSLDPHASVPEELLARRREWIRATAGSWSNEEADRVEAELRLLFDEPQVEHGTPKP